MFYVFNFNLAYIKVTRKLKIRVVYDIKKASYWVSKKSAKTWLSYVKDKHPQFNLVEAELTLKNSK